MSINSIKDFIKELKSRPDSFYIIHYSCQSLYDDNEGLSPRITSIVVQHYSTEQAVSFSTHAVAEELGVSRDDVLESFDQIEKKLLEDFYSFVRDRRDKYWIHWNMRSLTYGFEHIQHRYRVLTNEDAPIIPVERRVNLNDMVGEKYGKQYAGHPKMLKLMEMNEGRHRDFMNGEEEVTAFKNKKFIRMHSSTLCKVGFFSIVIRKMISGKLRVSSWGFGILVDRILEGRAPKIIALVAGLIGVLDLGYRFILALL